VNAVYYWMGPGWYAPRGEAGAVCYYWCGSDRTAEPDTYPMGLGTPEWLDEQPATSAGVEVK
jgi:hypothetical protein